LPRESLIDLKDKDFRLNGMPWGRVNYHWDGCYRGPTHFDSSSVNSYEHVHVLWQRDSMLLQSPVPKNVMFRDANLANLDAVSRVLLCVGALLCAITTDAEISLDTKDNSFTVGDWTVQEEDWQRPLFNLLREFRAAPEVRDAYYRYSKDDKRKEVEKRIYDLCRTNGLAVLTTEDAVSQMYDMTAEAHSVACAGDQRRYNVYAKRYQELLALEQLFIAA
jgi:hypothetical protein